MAETLAAVNAIERDELKKNIDSRKPFLLLETLAPEHFRNAHLPGARNAPPERVKELAPALRRLALVPKHMTARWSSFMTIHRSRDGGQE